LSKKNKNGSNSLSSNQSNVLAAIKLKDILEEMLKYLHLKQEDAKMIRFLDASSMKILTKSDFEVF